MKFEQAEIWLSQGRFAPFLSAAGGDHNRAVVLYQWHEELSAAIFARVQRLEILLRNAIDAELGRGQPQAPLSETWLFDLGVLRPMAVRQVLVAVDRLHRDIAVTRSRVVAGVSFGFWVALFDRSYEALWREQLHCAFPGAALARRDVGRPLRRIHQLRNRIAHHDCLLGHETGAVAGEMVAVAGWVDPAAAAWLQGVADVEAVLARRP